MTTVWYWRCGLPVDVVDPELPQDVVNEAVVAREELREDQRDRDERRDLRQDHAHPEDRPRPQLRVQEVREPERDQQLRNRRDHPDPERVLDRVPEIAVVDE